MVAGIVTMQHTQFRHMIPRFQKDTRAWQLSIYVIM